LYIFFFYHRYYCFCHSKSISCLFYRVCILQYTRDLQKAVYWYTKAANQGISQAQNSLSNIKNFYAKAGLPGAIIGAILLGVIFATASNSFFGFLIGAVAGWFIGKKIAQKIKESL